MQEVYGLDVTGSIYGSTSIGDKDKMLKYIAQQLGTMKSAREGNLRSWYEFAYELLAQYLITGTIKFNPLSASVVTGIAGWGRKQTRSSKDEPAREAINLDELESLASEIEGDLEGILGASVNQVFVMRFAYLIVTSSFCT